jgi:hypothetical protein
VTRLKCDLAAILGKPVVPLVDMRTATVPLARVLLSKKTGSTTGAPATPAMRPASEYRAPTDEPASSSSQTMMLLTSKRPSEASETAERGGIREDESGLRDLEVVAEFARLVHRVGP